MPTTTNFGWTTPADTDLVKDGAAAIRTLGNGIDTSLLDLKGGTTGQILSKNSNTDLDYTWITPNVGDITEVQAGTGISVASGTGPIPVVTNTVATAFDAKGDLIVGTGADTFAKLSVGTNDYVLTAASGETTGLKWSALPAAATLVGVSAYNSSAQSITTATWTSLAMDAENWDTDAFHSTSTNNTRFTVPTGKGGKYQAVWQLRLSGNATGIRGTKILKNGTTDITFNQVTPNQAGTVGWSNSGVITLSAGDYVEYQIYQASGVSLNAVESSSGAGGTEGCYFALYYLGA